MSKEIFDNQGNKIGEIRDKKSSAGGGGWLFLFAISAIVGAVFLISKSLTKSTSSLATSKVISGVCFFASKKYNMNVNNVRIFGLLFFFFSGGILGIAVYYYFYFKWNDEIKKITSSELDSK